MKREENLVVVPHDRVVAVRNPPNPRFSQRNIPFRCSMILANDERTKGKAMFKAKTLNITNEKRLSECIRYWHNAYYFCTPHLDVKTSRPVSTLSTSHQIQLLDNIVAVLLNLLLACNDLGKLNHAKLYVLLFVFFFSALSNIVFFSLSLVPSLSLPPHIFEHVRTGTPNERNHIWMC